MHVVRACTIRTFYTLTWSYYGFKAMFGLVFSCIYTRFKYSFVIQRVYQNGSLIAQLKP